MMPYNEIKNMRHFWYFHFICSGLKQMTCMFTKKREKEKKYLHSFKHENPNVKLNCIVIIDILKKLWANAVDVAAITVTMWSHGPQKLLCCVLN